MALSARARSHRQRAEQKVPRRTSPVVAGRSPAGHFFVAGKSPLRGRSAVASPERRHSMRASPKRRRSRRRVAGMSPGSRRASLGVAGVDPNAGAAFAGRCTGSSMGPPRKIIYSGTCLCGHSYEDHHLGAGANPEAYAVMGPPAPPAGVRVLRLRRERRPRTRTPTCGRVGKARAGSRWETLLYQPLRKGRIPLPSYDCGDAHFWLGDAAPYSAFTRTRTRPAARRVRTAV